MVSFQQDYDYLFKILLIGNSEVGKVLKFCIVEFPFVEVIRSSVFRLLLAHNWSGLQDQNLRYSWKISQDANLGHFRSRKV